MLLSSEDPVGGTMAILSAHFRIFHMLLLTSELTGIGTGQLIEEFYKLAHPGADAAITSPNSASGVASGNRKNRRTRKSFLLSVSAAVRSHHPGGTQTSLFTGQNKMSIHFHCTGKV